MNPDNVKQILSAVQEIGDVALTLRRLSDDDEYVDHATNRIMTLAKLAEETLTDHPCELAEVAT